MSYGYWNVFTNLFAKSTANPFALVAKPAYRASSLFSSYPAKYAYSATTYAYPNYTSFATPKFNFNFSNIFSGWKNGISSAYKNVKRWASNLFSNWGSRIKSTFNNVKRWASNLFSNWGSRIKSTFNNVKRWASNLGSGIVSTAKKYLGYNERNGSYKLFTGGKSHAWCADFSTYVVKEAFRNAGKSLPSGFGSSSVSGLMNWANSKGCFLQTAGITNKSSVIKGKVKAGDLIIFKNGGKSHVGVVESIGADGRINTIEGNTSNKVARRSYSANDRTITGFAQIA